MFAGSYCMELYADSISTFTEITTDPPYCRGSELLYISLFSGDHHRSSLSSGENTLQAVMSGLHMVTLLKTILAQIRAEKIEAEVDSAVMAARVSVSTDEPITERLLQYSSNPQKVRIVLSKLLRWAKKKPDIRMQTSLMTSEESRYADRENILQKKLKFSKLRLPDLVAQTVKLRSVKVSFPKAILSEVYFDLGDNVIRLRSCLHRASAFAHDFTNPIIIPEGLAAERLVLDAHERWMHASQKAVFNSLRQKYWFIGRFMYVKNLVRKLCKKKPVVGTSDT